MTTKVTVEVPASANWDVVVTTSETATVHQTTVEPGAKHEFYIWEGKRVVSIEEAKHKPVSP